MKRLLVSIFLAFGVLLYSATVSFAFDEFTVSNPRVENGLLTVEINPSPPDNICSWWQMLHHVYLTNIDGNRVGEFGSCVNNSDGTYTFKGGQAGGLLPDTGTYRVEVYLSEFSYDSISSAFQWISPVPHVNLPPTLQIFDSSQPLPDLPQYRQVAINLGETYSVNGSFTDTDSSSWTATVDYGNGEGIQLLSLNGNNFSLHYPSYTVGGSYVITVTVEDDQGAKGEIKRVVTVLDYNLEATNPRMVNGQFTVDLHGNFPDNLCSWFPALRHNAYIIDESSNSLHDFAGCFANGNGNYTITGSPVPPDGTYRIKIVESEQPPYPYTTVSNTFVWVANQPPVINHISDSSINEGEVYLANGSFTDSSSTSWIATVDYGEGAGTQSLSLNPDNTFVLSNLYEDNGIYNVVVTITDDIGAVDTETVIVKVNNVNPQVGTITASVNPIQISSSTTTTASFTDAGVLDTHTAVWDWGDGMTSLGGITENNGSGTVTGNHVYLAAGVYEVTLTVTDNSNASDTEVYQYLSVYNPTPQGLFSGARIFTSPQGAYPVNPNLTGQVQFGVTVKYDNNNQPTGNASMKFNAASFEFEATAVTVFVTSNGKATIRGIGTVNDIGGYTFLVTGIDGANDMIRFQIKDSSSTVVYDSQPGASDTADPTASVTGQIIVH